jgi:hypothetical protein
MIKFGLNNTDECPRLPLDRKFDTKAILVRTTGVLIITQRIIPSQLVRAGLTNIIGFFPSEPRHVNMAEPSDAKPQQ